jgi:hypothetical protein
MTYGIVRIKNEDLGVYESFVGLGSAPVSTDDRDVPAQEAERVRI